MKLIPLLMCCSVFIFVCYAEDNQNVVKDFFGKLKNRREKVKSDIHKFSEKIKSDIEKLVHPKGVQTDDKHGNTDGVKKTSNEEVLVFATTSKPTIAPSKTDNMVVFPTDEPIVFTTPQKPAEPATVQAKTDKSDSKGNEGKENFVGGCLAGYQRTADGRCMPVY